MSIGSTRYDSVLLSVENTVLEDQEAKFRDTCIGKKMLCPAGSDVGQEKEDKGRLGNMQVSTRTLPCHINWPTTVCNHRILHATGP